MQRAKDNVKTFGIVVGTLGVGMSFVFSSFRNCTHPM